MYGRLHMNRAKRYLLEYGSGWPSKQHLVKMVHQDLMDNDLVSYSSSHRSCSPKLTSSARFFSRSRLPDLTFDMMCNALSSWRYLRLPNVLLQVVDIVCRCFLLLRHSR